MTNPQLPAYFFADEVRETLIDGAYQRMVRAANRHAAHAEFFIMRVLVQGRSAAQIARMERDKGLTR